MINPCPYPDCKGERAHGSPHLIEAAAIEKRIDPLIHKIKDLEHALETILDTWTAPNPAAFAWLHKIVTGVESCNR